MCLDVNDVSVAEQIAAKGETNGDAKEQSGIDTVGEKGARKASQLLSVPGDHSCHPYYSYTSSFFLSFSPTLS